jgi:hypothetical protein
VRGTRTRYIIGGGGGRVIRLCRPSGVISPGEISTQETEGDEVHRAKEGGEET